jgi:hypothetical protein
MWLAIIYACLNLPFGGPPPGDPCAVLGNKHQIDVFAVQAKTQQECVKEAMIEFYDRHPESVTGQSKDSSEIKAECTKRGEPPQS